MCVCFKMILSFIKKDDYRNIFQENVARPWTVVGMRVYLPGILSKEFFSVVCTHRLNCKYRSPYRSLCISGMRWGKDEVRITHGTADPPKPPLLPGMKQTRWLNHSHGYWPIIDGAHSFAMAKDGRWISRLRAALCLTPPERTRLMKPPDVSRELGLGMTVLAETCRFCRSLSFVAGSSVVSCRCNDNWSTRRLGVQPFVRPLNAGGTFNFLSQRYVSTVSWISGIALWIFELAVGFEL